MATWQVQEAKARFSEVLQTAAKRGPQLITSRGVETAVVVPIAEWKRLQAQEGASRSDAPTDEEKRVAFLKLLRSSPDFEMPDRHKERLASRKAARR